MTRPVPEDKLRLGGMALRNGLLVHGPTHWAGMTSWRHCWKRRRATMRKGYGKGKGKGKGKR